MPIAVDKNVTSGYTKLTESTSLIKTGPLLDVKPIAQSYFLPEDAFDTHVHIFDPSLGPYSANRAYTPPDATLDELSAFSSSLTSTARPTNLVLVQPSPYGNDNQALLQTLENLRDQGIFVRAIAVVDVDNVKDEELQYMHNLGVRGLRLNMQASGRQFDVEDLKNLIKRAAARIEKYPNWKVQLFVPAYVWADLHSTILSLPVGVIADHTGGLLGQSKMKTETNGGSTSQAGFESLIDLAKNGRLLIKVSGLYRSSQQISSTYADMAPIVSELARQVPDSLIWGSDWPHTGEGSKRLNGHPDAVEPFRLVDNFGILQNLYEWTDSDVAWQKMMVDNPRRAFR